MVDNLTIAQRSFTMSRIRSSDTRPELIIRRMTHLSGLRFRKHVAWLPGRPDLAFIKLKVAVFVDGDYWHGWRFPAWQSKLGPYWRDKISGNRRRDIRNFCRLRRAGWHVIRIWEHQVEQDPIACVQRIRKVVQLAKDRNRKQSRWPRTKRKALDCIGPLGKKL
jgi:DNA mismatch endonuclease (patch repair protein)